MATMKLDIGGAETHIIELSKALKKAGVDVYVASRGGAFEKELADTDITHFNVPLSTKNPFSMIKSYRALKKLIKENNFDVVHAHARIPAFILGKLHKKMRFPFVTTAHWVFSTRFPFNYLTNWGERSLAVSEDIKKYLIENYNIKNENIRVTINGIDTEKFKSDADYSDIKKEFNLESGKTRIVYVSRMDTDRSLAAHKLIEIAPELYEKIENLEIVIVGGGNDYEAIKSEADAVCKKVGKRLIITTGSRTDINKFTASSDLFIGVSRAALEAMASEKPSIIAGNEGYIGIFDADKLKVSIDTNFCCRGCEETTGEKLKADILSLLEKKDEEKLAALGAFARETVKKYYSVDIMKNDALKMYASVITGEKINEVNEDAFIKSYSAGILPCYFKSVVISGYYGFHNSGDDSILAGIVSELNKKCPGVKITVLSKKPSETKKEYGVFSIGRMNLIKIIPALKKADLFISGGGSLLQDITSSKSLIYYTLLIRLAKVLKVKTFVYANGIGPVIKPKNRKTVKNVLNGVDMITLRESASLTELENIGVAKSVMLTADPVFSLSEENSEVTENYLESKGISADEGYFVLSVREWNTKKADFEKNISDFINEFSSSSGLMPVIIAMQPEKDSSISERIIKGLNVKYVFINDIIKYDRLLGILKGAKLCVAMRLHSLIYAAKTATPSIGIVYDPKVSAMLEYTNQNFYIDVKDVSKEKLLTSAEKILEDYDIICEKLKDRSDELTALAEKNALVAAKLII